MKTHQIARNPRSTAPPQQQAIRMGPTSKIDI